MGVYGERSARNVGVGEGSYERIANESMGSSKKCEDQKSRVEKTLGLARSDEVGSDGSV